LTEDLERLVEQDQWHAGTMHGFCGKHHVADNIRQELPRLSETC
jgi:hypothetical protein